MSPLSLEEVKQKILPILHKYHIKKASIFGSYARGEPKESSDIDLLVEVPEDVSLLDYIHIKHELESALNQTVDLVEFQALKTLIKPKILAEQVKVI